MLQTEREFKEQMEREEVFQIIPADGWRAGWLMENEGKLEVDLEPVTCWALIWSSQNQKEVIGVLRDGARLSSEDPAECQNFLGYLAPEEEVPESWKAQANRKQKKIATALLVDQLKSDIEICHLVGEDAEFTVAEFVDKHIRAGITQGDLLQVMLAFLKKSDRRAG